MRMGRTGCRWGGSAAHPPSHTPPPPGRRRAAGDSATGKPNEKQSPGANGIGSVPTTHIPAQLEGRLGGEGEQQSQILSRVQAAGIGAVPLAGAPHPQPALRCVPPPAAK